MHYLDNAATTAVHPEVLREITHVLEHHFANPSSLYEPGQKAEEIIQNSRQTLAAAFGYTGLLSASSCRVIFTGSGSEANNIAILGAARARKQWATQLVATGYEHPSAMKALQLLAQQEGFELTLVLPGPDGKVSPDKLLNAVGKKTALVCAMHVNNETGAVLDVAALARAVKKINNRTAVHVDGVQAFTKLPLNLPAEEIDTYAAAGHKIHAPKGIGALYLRKGFNIQPVLGGTQEWALRPGTENTAYIAGFAKAVEIAQAEKQRQAATVQHLRKMLLDELSSWDNVVLNSPDNGIPFILNLSIPGIRSETMLHHLESHRVYISSGSACSKGEASYTLTAMGLPRPVIDGALRISFSGSNTPEDVQALLRALSSGITGLTRGRPGE